MKYYSTCRSKLVQVGQDIALSTWQQESAIQAFNKKQSSVPVHNYNKCLCKGMSRPWTTLRTRRKVWTGIQLEDLADFGLMGGNQTQREQENSTN